MPWDITEKIRQLFLVFGIFEENEGLVIIFLVNLNVSQIHVENHSKKIERSLFERVG
jgi:hypothetical protein